MYYYTLDFTMNKYKLICLNYFKTLLLILIIIYSTYLFISPYEVFAMGPDDIIKSFNPDTYIRHELDGIPIYDSSRYIYNNREVYHNK